MTDWQPIETAPKDGKLFLCLFKGRDDQDLAAAIFWDDEDRAWRVLIGPDEAAMLAAPPTHWMPVPEPPR